MQFTFTNEHKITQIKRLLARKLARKPLLKPKIQTLYTIQDVSVQCMFRIVINLRLLQNS